MLHPILSAFRKTVGITKNPHDHLEFYMCYIISLDACQPYRLAFFCAEIKDNNKI